MAMSIEEAVIHMCGAKGTRYRLARHLKITPSAVYQWRHTNNGNVPELYELRIREILRKKEEEKKAKRRSK